MLTELLSFWLAQSSLRISLFINANYNKSKNLSNDSGKNIANMSDKVDRDKLITEEEFVTKKRLKIEENIKIKDLESLK